jgi:hypothetical protein
MHFICMPDIILALIIVAIRICILANVCCPIGVTAASIVMRRPLLAALLLLALPPPAISSSANFYKVLRPPPERRDTSPPCHLAPCLSSTAAAPLAQVLEVDAGASQQDISKSFRRCASCRGRALAARQVWRGPAAPALPYARRLSLQWHPDRNPGPDATENYQRITEGEWQPRPAAPACAAASCCCRALCRLGPCCRGPLGLCSLGGLISLPCPSSSRATAYAVLGDADARRTYDLQRGSDPTGGRARARAGAGAGRATC